MAVMVPIGVKTLDLITKTENSICGDPGGHCWGSSFSDEVWELNKQKTQILSKNYYYKCRHCDAYVKAEEIS